MASSTPNANRSGDPTPPLETVGGVDHSSQSSVSAPIVFSTTTTSSVTDHPLSFLPSPTDLSSPTGTTAYYTSAAPPPSVNTMDVELSERSSSTRPPLSSSAPTTTFYSVPPSALPPPPPPTSTFAAPSPTFISPPLLPPPPSQQKVLIPPPHRPPPPHSSAASSESSSVAMTVPTTLDDLADAFLLHQPQEPIVSSSSSLSESSSLPPTVPRLLRPPPLSDSVNNDNGLDKLRALAHRRAWADVVALANQLLRSSSSHYATLYSNVLLRCRSSQHHPHHHGDSSTTFDMSATSSLSSAAIFPSLTLESQQSELMEILSYQCRGLLKMRRYSELKHEVDQWLFCCHHHRFQSQSQPSQTTVLPIPWIPWSLHILAATTLVHTAPLSALPSSTEETNANDHTTASSRPSTATPQQQVPLLDAADALWEIRSRISSDDLTNRLQIEQALCNVFVQRRQWRMALQCLQSAIDLLPAAATLEQQHPQQSTSVSTKLETAYRCELLSNQGRILLQVGALSEASQVFQEAQVSWNDDDTVNLNNTTIVQRVPVQLCINDGLLRFAYGQYDPALEYFRKAISQIRAINKNHRPPDEGRRLQRHHHNEAGSAYLVGMSSLESLYSETCNNMALCAVYTCRLQEAVHVMESLVREDPTLYLTDRVALNLCTLYELGSDTAASSRKKRVLQVIAKRFLLHDIGPECFRLGS